MGFYPFSYTENPPSKGWTGKGKGFLFLLSRILLFAFSIFFERFHCFVKKQAHLFRLPV
ncbi:Uncharacterised protein [Mycobacteroides abscessus subsp. abscessus]|nr:Uncharacterised protein [Mycobacteroides abscessus subsp. abscessus]